jgi:hypothetical protein
LTPTITSFSPDSGTVGDGITKDNTIGLTGTAAANSKVSIYDGTLLLGSVTANSSGAWNYTTGTLSNGAHSFTAATSSQGDTGGSPSGFPNATTTGVPAGTVLSAVNGDFTSSYAGQVIDGLNVHGTIYINNPGVIVKNCQAQYIVVNSDHATIQDSDIIGNNFEGRDGIFIGANNTTVLRTDISGVENGFWLEANYAVIKDNYIHNLPYDAKIDPHLDGLQVPEGAGVSNASITHNNFALGTNQITSCLMMSDIHNSTISYNRFDGGGYTVYFEDGSSGNQVTSNTFAGHAFGYIYPGDSAGEAQTYNGNVTDTGTAILGGSTALVTTALKSASTTETSPPFSVTVDTVAPSAPTIAAKAATVTNVEVLSGNAEANSKVAVFDGATKLATVTANSSGAWSFTTAELSVGSHSFKATATDAAGNTGNASSTAAITITAAPAAPGTPTIASFSTDSGVAGDHITNDNTLTLTGKAAASSTVKVFDGSTQVGTATANSSGAWSLTTRGLADGNHSLSATATSLGAASVKSAPLSVTVDTHAPSAPTMKAYTQAGSVVANTTTLDDLVLKGTAEANSTVKVFDGSTAIGTAKANDSGAWSFDTGHLDVGKHSFKATASDVANNISSASAATSISVGMHRQVHLNSVSRDWSGVTKISGEASAGSQIKVLDGNTLLGSTVTDGSGSWTLTTDGLSNTATHTIKAQQVDSHGVGVENSDGVAVMGSTYDDIVKGTSGNDLFVGRAGDDTFVFAANFGNDIIRGFDAIGRHHDVVQFNKSVFDDFASVLDHASQIGRDVVISTGADALTLKHTKLAALDAHDFHFA